ncbi:hypothetical protein CBE37_00340 [bacterium TMED277]|nr:MAG: hypothetical protein CBE37_00340 [bacterium TMED277]|tara:strand:- start:1872 stop:2138 length:267 start_codon:yes stop_codon:yes gene_type:complete
MKVEINKKVTELIAEQIDSNSDEISLESSFEDLNIDSVGLVELVFSIEEYFEINIPFEELEEQDLKDKFSTVHSLIEVVTELSGKKQK